MRKIKIIFRNLKKYKKNTEFKARFLFTKYYDKLPIDDNTILIESFNGLNFNGSPYYIFKELCKEQYSKYIKYIAVNKDKIDQLKEFLSQKNFDMNQTKIIIRHSKKYCRVLSQAKYLINNVSFPAYFIKKEKQIYLNTWHGTPLKGLGRSINNNPHAIGNVIRNFLMADYIMYPNEYSFNHMRPDYMLDNLYKGEYLLTGSPNNDAFFDVGSREFIKKELGILDKKIIVYMPTWRDKDKNAINDYQLYYIMHLLYELENNCDDDTLIYVKLHHLGESAIDISDFKKIRYFPEEYETYEFLNIADALITDYSSVMFDFALTNKKIILYQYDKEKYFNGRSVYFDVEKLPFIKTDNVNDVCHEIKDLSNFPSYQKEMDKFIKLNYANSSEKICDFLINNNKHKEINEIKSKEFNNNKENVLIYTGSLLQNGITASLKGLLSNLDLDKYNFILTFYKNKVKNSLDFINNLDKKILYIPIQGRKNFTVSEAICHFLYFKLNLNFKFIQRKLAKVHSREVKRLYPNIKFKDVIHFTGYERYIVHIFGAMNAKKILYTHNDLKKELKTRKNVHSNTLKYAYENYDRIVIIRDTMKDEIISFYPKINKNKIYLVPNLNDIDNIINKSKLEISFDDNTYCNIELSKLQEILNNKKVYKFINVARYSPEKGIERLIEAFKKFKKQNPNNYLIIIGGHGKSFNAIKESVEFEDDNIILIKSLKNPFSILKKCDLFIMSSYYEGLPMAIMEALILNKPVVCTDITGPREFLNQGYGYLVSNSEEGLISGMNKFKDGELKNLKKFDSKEFNENALKKFYNLLK